MINGQWYEFDDQYVTEVHETVVQSAEAYVLFYRCAPRQVARVWGPGSGDPQPGRPAPQGWTRGALWVLEPRVF